MVGELGVNSYELLSLEWISNEILLCSTGNHVQSLMMEHDNVQKYNVYMCNWVIMIYSRKKKCIGEMTILKKSLKKKEMKEKL